MYRIGIDLGGTNIAAGIVNEEFKIIAKASVPTRAERAAEEIVADIALLCKDVCAKANIDVAEQGALTLEVSKNMVEWTTVENGATEEDARSLL